MIQPTLETLHAAQASGQYKIAPIMGEYLSDFITPIEALKILKKHSDHVYLLESISQEEHWGRYTYLGYDPKVEITCRNNMMKIDNVTFETNNPNMHIRDILAAHKSVRFEDFPTFTGGLVGYFAYDYLKYAEPSLHLDAKDSEGFNDCDLMLFDKVICFDNYKQKLKIIVNINLDNVEVEYQQAQQEIQAILALLHSGPSEENEKGHLKSDIKALFTEKQYCTMVEKAKHHIVEGDIFQIVLSNRLEADYEGSLFNMYRLLRTINPSPYMFYFASQNLEIAGASPETLVKLENDTLYTFPLAGTRPRGKTKEEDLALEQDLLNDPKELAEHNMLVDLGRNDIGKISRFGSVEVEKYHSIERYSHVMHIGSTVCGTIRKDKDALDAIDAILPAGTLSGAPKIMACQLINDLEDCKRGIYGGAIGYIDFTGNLDTCIAIRIAYKRNNKVYVRSGAGIVYDSVPEKEYQECLNKAAAVMNALKAAEEM